MKSRAQANFARTLDLKQILTNWNSKRAVTRNQAWTPDGQMGRRLSGVKQSDFDLLWQSEASSPRDKAARQDKSAGKRKSPSQREIITANAE
jgi:hypothetical protein